MKKPTLIKNSISADGRLYNVIIGTDMGQFSGTVEIRPEDEPCRSNYFGWELAEIKANIQYARAKKKYYDIQLRVLKEFWGNMSKTRTYDGTAFWVKKIEQQIEDLEVTAKWWKNRIDYLKETYHLKIVTFDSLNAKRNRCKEQNND